MSDSNITTINENASASTKKSISSVTIAFLLLLGMSLWVASGLFFPSPSTAKEEKQLIDKKQLFSVSYQHSVAEKQTKRLTINGTSSFSRKVDLKAEVEGKITTLIAQESTAIKKGDIILTIEKRDRERLLKQAQEFVKQKELDYDAARKLNQKGFSAETNMLKEAAALEAAKAALIKAEIQLSSTIITAPFDGFLERIYVDEGTLVGSNVDSGEMGKSNLATVIDVSPMLVIGHVSEKFSPFLKLGTLAEINMLSGEKLQGKLSYISSVANETTRTFRIEIEIANPDDQLYPSGSTSSISLPIREDEVHKLTLSTLVLDKKGNLGIHALDAPSSNDNANERKVLFYPVSIFITSPEYLWVSGLPKELDIITKGHGFVSPDQMVIGKLSQ